MRTVLAAALFLVSPIIFARAAPFGIVLTESCDTQIEDKSTTTLGINKYSRGPMYEVSAADIDFRNLKRVILVCGSNDTVVAVIAKLQKKFGGATFDRLVEILTRKYQSVSVERPHVGNRNAEFRSGDISIKVDEPHMSHTTELVYMTSEMMRSYERGQRQQKQEQNKTEESAL